MENRDRGLFITFEGGEGAGKTSQIMRLSDRLSKLGHSVTVTREPGGTPGAEIMRHVLLSGVGEQFGAEMEAILFSAARHDHVNNVIQPALEKGDIVLCDRFIDSTRVYQGGSGRVDMNFLHVLEDLACEDCLPDLTLLLDMDPKEGMRRAKARRGVDEKPDRFEKEALAAQEKRREGFLSVAKNETRIRIIDASGTFEAVEKRIWKDVKSVMSKKGLSVR